MLDAKILNQLRGIVGPDRLLSEPEHALAYECDAFAFHRHAPEAVLLVSSRDEVVRAVQIANQHRIPFVARGSGTGLSGGALPRFGGIVIALTRMNSILEMAYEDRQVVVQTGVIN